MRDILLCKKCHHFHEYSRRFHGYEHGFDKGLASLWLANQTCALGFHMHHCDLMDDRGVLLPHNQFKEYFNMECEETCTLYAEQFMTSLNDDFGQKPVDYGFWSRFKFKRVCQHCGRVIPNRKTCPVCGYEKFRYRDEAVVTFVNKHKGQLDLEAVFVPTTAIFVSLWAIFDFRFAVSVLLFVASIFIFVLVVKDEY